MPMPLFPYAQGGFCTVVNQVMGSPRARSQARTGLNDPNMDIGALAQQRANAPAGDPALPQADLTHFIAHWLTPDAAGSREFAGIPPRVVSQVLKEGFRRALEYADGGGGLPISVAWICNPDPNVFEVVTVVNRGTHVQVLIVTPLPRLHLGRQGAADDVHVTRFFATQSAIDDVLDRLKRMGNLNPAIHPPPGGGAFTPGSVGTFQIWT